MEELNLTMAKFGKYSGAFTEEKISADALKQSITSMFNMLPLIKYKPGVTADEVFSHINRYEIRSDDDGRGDPCTIEPSVAVNRFGTFLSSDIINFGSDGYIEITDNDYEFTGKIPMNIWILMEIISTDIEKNGGFFNSYE